MFLLRFTGDVMNCIPGYPLDVAILPDLLGFLDDLDQAWLTVLESQIWDPNSKSSSDLIVPADDVTNIRSTPMNPTERTRLRSLLISGTAKLEEWLAGMDLGEEGQDMLEQMGLQQSFDDLFSNTLGELGGFSEGVNNSTSLEKTC